MVIRACVPSSRKIEKIRSELKNTRDKYDESVFLDFLVSLSFGDWKEYLTILKNELRDNTDESDDASASVLLTDEMEYRNPDHSY